MENNIEQLNSFLESFKIKATCSNYYSIKNASYYDFTLLAGGRVADLQRIKTEMSLFLKEASSPRIEVLSKEGIVRFEFIKTTDRNIKLIELAARAVRPDGKFTMLLGEETSGKPFWFDIAEANHTIISGTTGSGKSALIHTIIANINLYKSAKTFIIDPKNEFKSYNKNPNMKVLAGYENTVDTLNLLIGEMERRYAEEVVNPCPVFLIIDEFADLVSTDSSKRIHALLCRLAQKSRASKIYIILATQRPSVKVINGEIKSNFPGRIALKSSSRVDSQVILDETGAEELQGHGDALVRYNGKLVRIQCAQSR